MYIHFAGWRAPPVPSATGISNAEVGSLLLKRVGVTSESASPLLRRFSVTQRGSRSERIAFAIQIEQ